MTVQIHGSMATTPHIGRTQRGFAGALQDVLGRARLCRSPCLRQQQIGRKIPSRGFGMRPNREPNSVADDESDKQRGRK